MLTVAAIVISYLLLGVACLAVWQLLGRRYEWAGIREDDDEGESLELGALAVMISWPLFCVMGALFAVGVLAGAFARKVGDR